MNKIFDSLIARDIPIDEYDIIDPTPAADYTPIIITVCIVAAVVVITILLIARARKKGKK